MQFMKQRRTPWDEELMRPRSDTLYPQLENLVLAEPPTMTGFRCKDVIYLRGRWLVDPTRATSEDVRQFMWAGLRVLRAEAKSRGVTEEQVDRLLARAFDTFHDIAESIWTTLKTLHQDEDLVSSSGCAYIQAHAGASTQWHQRATSTDEDEKALAPPKLFIACEEDRPVPVKMQFNKPLTLLDPDAEILASFEP